MKRTRFLIATVALAACTAYIPLQAHAEDASFAPGQIIVQYQSEVVPHLRARARIGQESAGIASYDAIELDAGVETHRPVFADSTAQSAEGSFYVLTFDPDRMTVKQAVDRFSNYPLVVSAEPNYYVEAAFTPDDALYSLQWNFPQIGMEEAWDTDTTSPIHGGDPDIIVAVVDTGVAYADDGAYAQADDLADTRFVAGYDFVNDNTKAYDDNGHGTLMTGTIAQSTDNATGAAGIAFETTILPVKVLNSSGVGTMDDIAAGIDYAREQGANVISMSLGGTSGTIALEAAIQSAVDDGIILVAAAGNGGDDDIGDAALNYPAAYPDVIAISATRYDRARSSYANYGENLDLMAPGGDTSVDQNEDGQADGILQQGFQHVSVNYTDFAYLFSSGTSAATAHVSGAVALLMGNGASAASVEGLLTTTAEDLGASGYDEGYGYGLIDVAAAMNQLVTDEISPSTSFSTSTAIGASGWYTSRPTITLAAEDNAGGGGVASTYYYWDEKERETYTAPFAAPEGEHTLHYRSVDAANNRETLRAQVVSVDTTAPVFSVVSPTNGTTTGDRSIFVSGKVTDVTSGVASLTVNGKVVSVRSNKTFDAWIDLTPGDNAIAFIATDIAGNSMTLTRTVQANISQWIVTGTGPGGGPHVRVFEPDGTLVSEFFAYADTFRGGVNVAIGDVDGDGEQEVVTAPASAGGPHVRVFSLDGTFEMDFFAYDEGFRGGVNIGVGNVEGKGAAEIITAPASAGGPNIRIFGLRNRAFVPTTENFMAYDPAFRGGVNIAVLDMEGNGTAEIVTTPASAGGPQIRIFGFRSGVYVPVILGTMAYDPAFRGGVTLGGGDIDGDGADEILTGVASAGGPQVRIFERVGDGTIQLKNPGFMAYDPAFRGGIELTASDIDHDGKEEIITGTRSDAAPVVRVFSADGSRILSQWNAYAETFLNGIRLGGES